VAESAEEKVRRSWFDSFPKDAEIEVKVRGRVVIKKKGSEPVR